MAHPVIDLRQRVGASVAWLTALEDRMGRPGPIFVGMVLGVALVGLAAVYATPALQSIYMGMEYQVLSSDPWTPPLDPLQVVRARILTPLVAWAVGMRGERFIFVPLLVGASFLGAIYAWFRREGHTVADAAVVPALLASTVPIVHTIRMPGYVDTTTYLVLFGCFVSIERGSRWWALWLALGLMNHESILFFSPFFALLLLTRSRRTATPRGVALSILLAGAALVPWLVWRDHLGGLGEGRQYYEGVGQYVTPSAIRHNLSRLAPAFPIGTFMGFKLAWGLPLALAWVEISERRLKWTGPLALLMACVIGQLVVAADTTRLMGPAFIAVLVAARELMRRYRGPSLTKALWALVGANLLVPQLIAGPFGICFCYPWPVSYFLYVFSPHRFSFYQPVWFAPM